MRNVFKNPPFVMKKIEMLRSDGYKKLSSNAKVLWEYLRSKYNPYKPNVNPVNDKIQVYLTYEEMKSVNGFSSPKSMSKAIKELIQDGFIEKTEQGGLYRGMSAYHFIGSWASFQSGALRLKKRGKY